MNNIYKMSREDYDKVKTIYQKIYDMHADKRNDIFNKVDSLPLDYYKELITNAICLVYKEEKEILGFIIAKENKSKDIPVLKQRTTYFIEGLGVDENHIRKGIGKKLYLAIKEEAKKNSIDAIELNVWSFNQSAIEFYKHLGLKPKSSIYEDKL